jgi:hypothetical protein
MLERPQTLFKGSILTTSMSMIGRKEFDLGSLYIVNTMIFDRRAKEGKDN